VAVNSSPVGRQRGEKQADGRSKPSPKVPDIELLQLFKALLIVGYLL
jgi:hypothetical protein